MALDGKTLRGTMGHGQTQGVHLLAACLPGEGAVLMQVAVDRKENEIAAAPRLLSGLDFRGKVVTGDALLSQRPLSTQIVKADGDYLWKIKYNQHSTYRAQARCRYDAYPAEALNLVSRRSKPPLQQSCTQLILRLPPPRKRLQ